MAREYHRPGCPSSFRDTVERCTCDRMRGFKPDKVELDGEDITHMIKGVSFTAHNPRRNGRTTDAEKIEEWIEKYAAAEFKLEPWQWDALQALFPKPPTRREKIKRWFRGLFRRKIDMEGGAWAYDEPKGYRSTWFINDEIYEWKDDRR